MSKKSDILDSFNGVKWNNKGVKKEEGLHCLTLIILYLNELGADIPIERGAVIIGEYTYDNINEKFHQNNKKTVDDMIEYLSRWVKEIPTSNIQFGDLIVIEEIDTSILSPAIYVGNGKILGMEEYGVFNITLGSKFIIKRVFRREGN